MILSSNFTFSIFFYFTAIFLIRMAAVAPSNISQVFKLPLEFPGSNILLELLCFTLEKFKIIKGEEVIKCIPKGPTTQSSQDFNAR